MDCATSDKFIHARDLSIVFCGRYSDLPVKTILEARRCDVVSDSSGIVLRNKLIAPVPSPWFDFIDLRDQLFPNSEMLFPTVNGTQYYQCKFSTRIKKLLAEAGQKTSPSHPRKLTEGQFRALVNLRFRYWRQDYQRKLAAALCSFWGLRSSEVAKLEKRDIDFSARLLHLRATKSQEDQKAPLLSFMIESLECYTAYLPDTRSPLFVNMQGAQWERRDVELAITRWGTELGIRDLTPQKLRASLGAMLARRRIPPALIAKILRHKDPATALRYYNFLEMEEARYVLEKVTQDQNFELEENTVLISEYERFYRDLEGKE